MTPTDSPAPLKTETAVIGSGYMGGGIAQVLALHGHPVALADVDAEAAEASRTRLVEQAKAFEDRGLMPSGAGRAIAENLTAAKTVEHAAAGAAYITEAVPESHDIKSAALQRISACAAPEAIIATNTSALPIAALSSALAHPERFLGVHWMNPAPFIPGVELIPGPVTSEAVLAAAEGLIRSLGKTTARVADTPGFVANRLQFALYKEAARMVEEGAADPEQIDAVVSSTFGFRLALFGPFAIGDMAGLDVYHSSYRTLEHAYGERFSPPPALSEAVGKGHLGFKSGQGILPLGQADQAQLLARRDAAYARLSQLRDELTTG